MCGIFLYEWNLWNYISFFNIMSYNNVCKLLLYIIMKLFYVCYGVLDDNCV